MTKFLKFTDKTIKMNPEFFRKIDKAIKMREQMRKEMREELLRNGFAEELCIHGLNEMVVYVIPGEHWSVEVFDDSPGTRVLMATIPVSSVSEIETICNNHNILFRFTSNIQSLKKYDL